MKPVVIAEVGVGVLFTWFALSHHRLAKVESALADNPDLSPQSNSKYADMATAANQRAALYFIGGLGAFGLAAYTTWK